MAASPRAFVLYKNLFDFGDIATSDATLSSIRLKANGTSLTCDELHNILEPLDNYKVEKRTKKETHVAGDTFFFPAFFLLPDGKPLHFWACSVWRSNTSKKTKAIAANFSYDDTQEGIYLHRDQSKRLLVEIPLANRTPALTAKQPAPATPAPNKNEVFNENSLSELGRQVAQAATQTPTIDTKALQNQSFLIPFVFPFTQTDSNPKKYKVLFDTDAERKSYLKTPFWIWLFRAVNYDENNNERQFTDGPTQHIEFIRKTVGARETISAQLRQTAINSLKATLTEPSSQHQIDPKLKLAATADIPFEFKVMQHSPSKRYLCEKNSTQFDCSALFLIFNLLLDDIQTEQEKTTLFKKLEQNGMFTFLLGMIDQKDENLKELIQALFLPKPVTSRQLWQLILRLPISSNTQKQFTLEEKWLQPPDDVELEQKHDKFLNATQLITSACWDQKAKTFNFEFFQDCLTQLSAEQSVVVLNMTDIDLKNKRRYALVVLDESKNHILITSEGILTIQQIEERIAPKDKADKDNLSVYLQLLLAQITEEETDSAHKNNEYLGWFDKQHQHDTMEFYTWVVQRLETEVDLTSTKVVEALRKIDEVNPSCPRYKQPYELGPQGGLTHVMLSFAPTNITTPEKEQTFAELLQRYEAYERTDPLENVECEYCTRIGMSLQRTIREIKNVFCFQLKRFDNARNKLDTPFTVENEIEIMGQKFTLYAYISQTGSTTGGHYTACVQTNQGWHLFNDHEVTKLDGTTLHAKYTRTVYVLFYRRTSLPTSYRDSLVGLNNAFGQSCFANACLQCMYGIPEYRDIYLTGDFTNATSKSIQRLFIQMQKQKRGQIGNSDMKNIFYDFD